ncbi:MAG: hypothetical protein ACOYUZ_04555 [Patescibacteria group bacterium]
MDQTERKRQLAEDREHVLALHELYEELRDAIHAKLKEKKMQPGDLGSHLNKNKQRCLEFLAGERALIQGNFLTAVSEFAGKQMLGNLIGGHIQKLHGDNRAVLALYSIEIIDLVFLIQVIYADFSDDTGIEVFASAFSTNQNIIRDMLFWKRSAFDALNNAEVSQAITDEATGTKLVSRVQKRSQEYLRAKTGKQKEFAALLEKLKEKYASQANVAKAMDEKPGTISKAITAEGRYPPIEALEKLIEKAQCLLNKQNEPVCMRDETPSSLKSDNKSRQPATKRQSNGQKSGEQKNSKPAHEPAELKADAQQCINGKAISGVISALHALANTLQELTANLDDFEANDRYMLARAVVLLMNTGQLDDQDLKEAWQGNPITDPGVILRLSLMLSPERTSK